MGNVSEPILTAVASQRNLIALGTGTKPTENQVLGWLDRCVWDLIVHCLPRREQAGELTAGRLDLLSKTTQKEIKSGTTGTAAFPSTAPMALQYLSILAGTGTGEPIVYTLYAAREVTYGDLLNASLNAIYTPAATEPVYAFADGKLYYLPTSHTYVDYHYIELPAALTNASNWPLCDSLIPCGLFFALKEMWKQLGDIERGSIWEEAYQKSLERITGYSYKIIELWSR